MTFVTKNNFLLTRTNSHVKCVRFPRYKNIFYHHCLLFFLCITMNHDDKYVSFILHITRIHERIKHINRSVEKFKKVFTTVVTFIIFTFICVVIFHVKKLHFYLLFHGTDPNRTCKHIIFMLLSLSFHIKALRCICAKDRNINPRGKSLFFFIIFYYMVNVASTTRFTPLNMWYEKIFFLFFLIFITIAGIEHLTFFTCNHIIEKIIYKTIERYFITNCRLNGDSYCMNFFFYS